MNRDKTSLFFSKSTATADQEVIKEIRLAQQSGPTKITLDYHLLLVSQRNTVLQPSNNGCGANSRDGKKGF